MLPTITLPAPVKINLFLHINGRRADGYHELQTAFQFLDFGDTINFNLRKDQQIRVDSTLDIPLQENLLWKAANALQSYANVNQGVDLQLVKRIPIGSGLGGGSSDAATVLVGLNWLWQTGLSMQQLETIAVQLGADVPIFVRGQASWAEGVGELLTPLPWSKQQEGWYVVVNPPCSVNTAAVFIHPQLTRDTPRRKIADFLANTAEMRNDFESLVRALYPPVDRAFVWLNQFGLDQYARARLTGSGSSVFACVPNQAAGEQILQQLPTPYTGFVAKAMKRSRLYVELDNKDLSHIGVSPSGKAPGFDPGIPRFES